MFRTALVFLFLCLSLLKVTAQNTVFLDDTMKEFVFSGEYLAILEDKSGKLTIADVSSTAYQDQFILNKSSYPYNENIQSTYWIKFKVKNRSKSGKHFLLESYAPHTNKFELYIQKGDTFDLKVSGLDLDFYKREYVNKNLILNLPLDTNSTHVFYVKVLSVNHSSFDFRIKPQTDFFFYSVNEYFFLGMFSILIFYFNHITVECRIPEITCFRILKNTYGHRIDLHKKFDLDIGSQCNRRF